MSEHWRSSGTIETLKLRAQVYQFIRSFFMQREVLEVETPILSEAGNTDPNIESFHLHFSGASHAGNAKRWLRTSPEFALKRLLASGIGDCYELGRVFRNGEFGGKHNPEFTMLEWYRVGWNHQQLIEECLALVEGVFSLQSQKLSVRRFTYQELYLEHVGLDPHQCSDADLTAIIQQKIKIDLDGLTRDDYLNLIMTHLIEPMLPTSQLTVVYDFPASQCALAKIRNESIPVAERFELYLGSFELANGYHELTDSIEQRRRFTQDLLIRTQRKDILPDIDERLLQSMSDMPACSGVAMGVDRLMMALSNHKLISEVITFDFSRA
jgi:lysyl-tRNA synthetase class 2